MCPNTLREKNKIFTTDQTAERKDKMSGKRSVTILAVIIILCLSACGTNPGQEDMDRQTQHAENSDADESENVDAGGREDTGMDETVADEAGTDEAREENAEEAMDYGNATEPWAVDGTVGTESIGDMAYGPAEGAYSEISDESTYDEMWERFHEQFYDGMSSEEMERLLVERNEEYLSYSHYDIVTDYWENVREVRDVANRIDPLFFTDMKYYKAEDFADAPEVVIKLARNEIYAKHGYIFKDEDLNHYFNGCIWYTPECGAEDFDDSVLNEYERANLELLSEIGK